MPADFGIGDHHHFVINFSADNMIGTSRPMVVRPMSQRINTKILRVAAEYVKILEAKVLQHRLIKQTGKAHRKSKSRASLTKHLNHLDRKLGQYMRYAGKNAKRSSREGSGSLQKHHCGYAVLKSTGLS